MTDFDKINASEAEADKWLRYSMWFSIAVFILGAVWFGYEIWATLYNA